MVERHAAVVVDVSALHSTPYFPSSESSCLLCMCLSYVIAYLYPVPRWIVVWKLVWAVFRQIAGNDVKVFSKSFVIRGRRRVLSSFDCLVDDHRVVVYRVDVVLHFLLYKLFGVVEQIVLRAGLVDSLESVKLCVLGHVCLNCRPRCSPSRVFCAGLSYRHVSVLSVSWISAESPWRHSVALP